MLKLFLLVFLTVNVLVDSIPIDAPVIQEHIVGGNDTDISKVPYQVAVYEKRFFYCGGSILSPTHIITAGHCVNDVEDTAVVIRAGSNITTSGGVIAKTKKVYRHPNFTIKTVDYDVAIIELSTPLQLNNKTMKAIKLAAKEPSPGSSVLVSGWGCLKENGARANTLQSVAVPVVDRKVCQTSYKSHNITITPRMMCAGLEGKDSCQGDSGGPLASKGELVGIVSFGVGCGRKDFPGIYTNIADPEITKFIKSIVKV